MEKKEVLSKIGAINKKPEKVADNPLFKKHAFFDPLDNVQVKYEMLRSNQVDQQKVTHICKQFGYSREAFYVILRKFKKHGIAGLLEESRQKKNTILLNEDIANMIIQAKFQNRDISGAKLAQKINAKFNTDYKKRAVEKAVKTLNLTKKKSQSR
jgi:transposase